MQPPPAGSYGQMPPAAYGAPGMPPAGSFGGPPPVRRGVGTMAVVSLVLAVVGLLGCGCVTSLPAVFIARAELAAIERGESSPEGRGLAQAGFWIGLIDVILVTLVVIVYLILIAVGVVASVASGP